MNPAVYWSLGAAVPAVANEYMYRQWPGSWFDHAWIYVPLQLMIGYCVFRLITTPNLSFMDSFVIWSFATLTMRVFVTLVLLRDPVSKGTWAALALVVLARIVQSVWGGR